MNSTQNKSFNYIIVGGGLQAALIVKALRHYQSTASILLIEKAEMLCGNHTWSFHASDVPNSASCWVGGLPIKSWEGYTVEFPGLKRRVGLKYCSLQSADVRQAISNMAGDEDENESLVNGHSLELLTGTSATKVDSTSVETADGQLFNAELVIDCRGLTRDQMAEDVRCGYQKFHGFEIQLSQEWASRDPVLMDARISQADGFRFLYVLPLNNRRVLIEDTCFSDNPRLQRADCLRSMKRYLEDRSVSSFEIVREEQGCLPMPYSKNFQPQLADPLRGGYAGGWFHAATGYSFPLAVRFADAVASIPPHEAPQRILRLARQNQFQARFARFLNRLLFRAVKADQRWQIFRRFYRAMPDPAIERFYAHQFTRLDAARMIIGAPPRGLTPVRFFNSFEASPCLATQS